MLLQRRSGTKLPHPWDEQPGWMRWLLFVFLAGYLLFAHGCHADTDTELIIRSSIGKIQPASRAP